jgi:hypothetical protein
MTRVIITGDRTWAPTELVATIVDRLIAKYVDQLVVVHGDEAVSYWLGGKPMAIVSDPAVTETGPAITLSSENELLRRNEAAIALLDEWDREVDDQEQRKTMQIIRDALGNNRIGAGRALFP